MLVINDTRVIPARLLGVRITSAVPEERAAEHEKNCEVLLLKRLSLTDWECIVRPGKKLRTGAKIYFSPRLSATVTGIKDEGVRVLTFETDGELKHYTVWVKDGKSVEAALNSLVKKDKDD